MGRRIVLFSGLAALGLLLFLYPIRVLTLTKNQEIIFLKSAHPGDTFQLAFLHSIALSEVRDSFLIDSQYNITLTETRFQGQAAGLPYNLARGEQLHHEGDWFRITGMHRMVPAIFWRVQSPWRNRFRFGKDSEWDLSASLGDALIQIQVEKMNLPSYLAIFLKSKNPFERKG